MACVNDVWQCPVSAGVVYAVRRGLPGRVDGHLAGPVRHDMLKCVCGMCAMYSSFITALFYGFQRRNLLDASGLADLAEREYGEYGHFHEVSHY